MNTRGFYSLDCCGEKFIMTAACGQKSHNTRPHTPLFQLLLNSILIKNFIFSLTTKWFDAFWLFALDNAVGIARECGLKCIHKLAPLQLDCDIISCWNLVDLVWNHKTTFDLAQPRGSKSLTSSRQHKKGVLYVWGIIKKRECE